MDKVASQPVRAIRRPLGIGVLGSMIFKTEGCIGAGRRNPGDARANPGNEIFTFLIIKVEIPGKTSSGIIDFVKLH